MCYRLLWTLHVLFGVLVRLFSWMSALFLFKACFKPMADLGELRLLLGLTRNYLSFFAKDFPENLGIVLVIDLYFYFYFTGRMIHGVALPVEHSLGFKMGFG